MSTHRYYGKYRGTVAGNVDPQQIGRIQATVPDVLGSATSSWAMPCLPGAASQAGIFVVPAVGSAVWIEFEQGDPDYPVWTGGFWGQQSDVPPMAFTPPAPPPGQNIVIQTSGGVIVAASDAPPTPTSGGIVLQSKGGALIVVNDSGIYISNGQGAAINLVGPSVDINSGGLTVT